MSNIKMRDVRCPYCHKLLFKVKRDDECQAESVFEVKCPRCKTVSDGQKALISPAKQSDFDGF